MSGGLQHSCSDCEICGALAATGASSTEVAGRPARRRSNGRSPSRRRTCTRCGHPIRHHALEVAPSREVVDAPLPNPLPVGPTAEAERSPVSNVPRHNRVEPLEPATPDTIAEIPEPVEAVEAVDLTKPRDPFTSALCTLADLYQTGLLDDAEFKAAKHRLLEDHAAR